jgi:O-antigen ligase
MTGISFFGFAQTTAFFIGLLLFVILYITPPWFTIWMIIFASFVSLGYTISFLPLSFQQIIVVIALSKFFFSIKQRENIKITRLDILILLLGVWVLLSSIVNNSINILGTGIIRFASFMILYFLISRFIYKSSEIRKVFILMSLSGIILLIFNYFEYRVRTGIGVDTYGSNTLAGQLAILTLVSMYFALSSSHLIHKFLFWVLTVSYVIGIIINSSRGALIAMFIGVLIFLMLQHFSFRLILAVGLIGCIAFYISSHISDVDYVNSLFRLLSSNPIDDRRLLIWKANIYYIQHNPVWGIGFGNFALRAAEYGNFFGNLSAQYANSSHNMYLSILTETGIPGFLFFISAIIYMLVKLLRLRLQALKTKNLLLFSLTNILVSLVGVYLVHGIVADVHLWEYFWIIIGISQGLLIVTYPDFARKYLIKTA